MSEAPVLEVRDLVKQFPARRGGGSGPVRAVDGVSFRVDGGSTLALVGESGCGKTTTARAILRLVPPDAGLVLFRGRDLAGLEGPELTAFRRRAQIVFQDPQGALNPRLSVGKALAEPLRVHGLLGEDGVSGRVLELLDRVGLGPEVLGRYPHELSGGQRQRVGIARALAVEPELLVLDEPVSSLDVSVQAQVMTLLARLQEQLGLTYLLIAHDLALVREVSDRVAVMYRGRIMEEGPTGAIFAGPLHPYTRLLLESRPRPASSPAPFPEAGSSGVDPAEPPLTEGRRAPRGPPDPGGVAPPVEAGSVGCPFYPRCAHPDRGAACIRRDPPLEAKERGRFAACIKVRGAVRTGG